MNIESGFSQVAQSLLWPVLVLVGLAFVYALWVGGATLMEAWQRWRQPQYRSLRAAPGLSMEELELQLVRQVEPVRLLSRAFAGVVLALAAASVGLVVYSVRRRWLLAELLVVRKERGVAQ